MLGISRQAVNWWKKFEDAPRPDANGLHDVQAWREFMARRVFKGGDIGLTDEQSRLKARKPPAEVQDREFRLSVRRGEFVSVEVVRQEWGRRAGRVIFALRNLFENTLPPVLSGMDAVGIQKECRKAIDELLELISGGNSS